MQVIIFVVTLMIGVSGDPQLGFLQANVPGNIPGNNNGVNNNNNLNGNTNNGGGLLGGAFNRQGGLSFVIPGLSLLAGGGNNGGGNNGNIFGTATVTRTLVSTVTTVTTPSFRTCTMSAAGLMPCAAGRRKRDENAVVHQENKIDATPVMELIIGGTTLIEREAVSEFLEAHKPSTQSVIYPPGIEQVVGERIKINPRLEEVVAEGTTVLYPSLDDDVGEEEEVEREEIPQEDEGVGVTTETPILLDDLAQSTTLEPRVGEDDEQEVEFARGGFGRKTTTVTTVIRVTSVATSLATGTSATLTVNYAGCMPPSLPVSGTACTP